MNRLDFYGEALTALVVVALYLAFIVALYLAFRHPAPAREFEAPIFQTDVGNSTSEPKNQEIERRQDLSRGIGCGAQKLTPGVLGIYDWEITHLLPEVANIKISQGTGVRQVFKFLEEVPDKIAFLFSQEPVVADAMEAFRQDVHQAMT